MAKIQLIPVDTGIRSRSAVVRRTLTLIRWFYPIAKFYWFIFRPTTFGVRGVIKNNGKVLMIKNTYGNTRTWMFPGGGIKKSETPEQAFVREIKEEVGLAISDIKKIGEYTSTAEYKIDNVKVFSGESNASDLKIQLFEILEAKWFDLNNMPEISPNSRKILSMLSTESIKNRQV